MLDIEDVTSHAEQPEARHGENTIENVGSMSANDDTKSRRDLDLDRTLPNVELVPAIFKYYHMFEPLFFELSCTQTEN